MGDVPRIRPIHGFAVVVAFMATLLLADYALDGGARRSGHERVTPDRQGLVRIDVSQLGPSQVHFYHFINFGNQEVDFFIARDEAGAIQAAFDANEVCAKKKRGYRHEGEWVVCNFCDKSFRLSTVNEGGGGCKPVPLAFRVQGDQLLLAEGDVLQGWRLFR